MISMMANVIILLAVFLGTQCIILAIIDAFKEDDLDLKWWLLVLTGSFIITMSVEFYLYADYVF